MVVARFRRLAQGVPGRGARPGPDPADLLRILAPRTSNPGTVTLRHRSAPHHPRGRHIAPLNRPGHGRTRRGRAGLVGASLLNLVDSVIREQERLPQAQRRGALVVVDEMQTIPGVEFESLLSELGKYGASFVLATQSLAKLNDLSPTMRHTLLANVGCLAVFQVSGCDVRELVWELGRERLTKDDIVSQPVHHCYVCATVGAERLPAFSMAVRKPEFGDPERAARIRAAASVYVTPLEALETQQAERRRAVAEFRKGVESLHQSEQSPPLANQTSARPKSRDRRRQPERDATETIGGEQ